MGCTCTTLRKFNFRQRTAPLRWKHLASRREIKKKYCAEGLVDSGSILIEQEIELLALLDDKDGFELMKKRSSVNPRSGWIKSWEILQKKERLDWIHLSDVCTLCSSILQMDSSKEPLLAEVETISLIIGNARTKSAESDSPYSVNSVKLSLKRICLQGILVDLYLPSLERENYDNVLVELGSSFNRIALEDFKYFGRIGSGAFGVVLHCVKSSTGEQYAMKVMLKASILRFYRRTPEKVMVERNALSSFDHPYLMSLSYAFQTPTLAIMVMPLGSCGDLSTSLRMSLLGRFSLKRVKFYVAEIICGLSYLHANGIIYRDLKPQNVLLNADGHIMLADFGNIADTAHRVGDVHRTGPGTIHSANSDELPRYSNENSISYSMPLLSRENSMSSFSDQRVPSHYPPSAQRTSENGERKSKQSQIRPDPLIRRGPAYKPDHAKVFPQPAEGYDDDAPELQLPVSRQRTEAVSIDEASRHSKMIRTPTCLDNTAVDDALSSSNSKSRAKSIVGTLAFMAPEVVRLFGHCKLEYSKEVDCWSLGVLVYNLYTGQYPFRLLTSCAQVQRAMPLLLRKHNGCIESAFTDLFGPLQPFPRCCSDEDTWELVQSLLQFNPKHRPILSSVGSGLNSFQTPACTGVVNNFTDEDSEEGQVCCSESNAGNKEDSCRATTKVGSPFDIHNHGFFSDIDWALILRKELPPPYIPVAENLHFHAKSSGDGSDGSIPFRKLMASLHCGNWVDGNDGDEQQDHKKGEVKASKDVRGPIEKADIGQYCLTQSQQSYFINWDFVSPSVIDTEIAALKGHDGGGSTMQA